MDTSVIEKAKARLSEIEKERKEIIDFISITERMTEKFGNKKQKRIRLRLNEPTVSPSIESEGVAATALILDCVEDILSNSNDPMPPAELIEKLQQRGVTVGGKNPNNNLSAKLSNARDRFISIHGQGWKLKKNTKVALF